MRAEIATGKKLPVALWDQEMGRLNGKAPTTVSMNRSIDAIRIKLQEYYELLELEHEHVALPSILKKC